MTSEGRIFRRAFGALDRLAPVAPDFNELGILKLTSVPTTTPGPSRWMMAAAAATVVVLAAAIPTLLLGDGGGPLGSGNQSPPTTGAETTTSTICAESLNPAVTGPCPTSTAPPTTAPSGTTTTTIEATGSSTTIPVDPNRVFTVEEAEDFLRGFLGLLAGGFYELAEPLYAGDYDQLIEWNPTIDPDSRFDLLASGCRFQLLCDYEIDEVMSGESDGGIFTFEVTLISPDGVPLVWADEDGSTRMVWPFQVMADGGILRSLSLPPYLP